MNFRNLLLGVAIFGLGWGASFGAGAAFGRRTATAAPVQSANAGAAQLPGGGAGGPAVLAGGSAGPGGAGGAAALFRGGTIERVEGQTLVLAGPNGQPMRVTLTDQTQILTQATGSTADLTPGERVTVQPQGPAGADGTITAAVVTLVPAGAPAGGAVVRPGQPAGGQRQQRPGG